MLIRRGAPAPLFREAKSTGPPVPCATPGADGPTPLISQLAAELSHDLAVPLTSIIANLELLEEELADSPNPVVDALLARTTRAAGRMRRMLDQRMELGTAPSVRTHGEVDLREVANQLADDASQLLVLAGARLNIGWLPVVRADPDAMYSVLQNLLTNAVKFTRPGVGPRLCISSSRVPNGWRISMTDNGIGIPAQRRADVFTPFIRANADAEGHGIGLGRVARIVYSLGGRVGADEVSGGGADVWFELPARSDG
jgi:signal transduction histidine kinase